MQPAIESGFSTAAVARTGKREQDNQTVRELTEYLSRDPMGQWVLKLSKVEHPELDGLSEDDQLSLLELALLVRQLKALI